MIKMRNLTEEEIVLKKQKFWNWKIQWMVQKNAIVSINSRLDQTKERICELEDSKLEVIK